MERIAIFALAAALLVTVYVLVQAVSFMREAGRTRMPDAAPAPALPTLPEGTVAARAHAIRLAEERRLIFGADQGQGMSEEESRDADRMAVDEEHDVVTQQAIAEMRDRVRDVDYAVGDDQVFVSHTIPARASIPQEDASPRVLNIGGVHYAVPELAARGNLVPGQGIPGVADAESAEAFERRVINDLMLRRGRQLMVENNWTAQQAADAVTEMVRVAGIQGVEEVMAPRPAATAQLERPMSPEQRLRLAEDMMMRHAENLIRGGVPVEEAATRAADWGMQFAYSGPAPRAERRPTVREVWSD